MKFRETCGIGIPQLFFFFCFYFFNKHYSSMHMLQRSSLKIHKANTYITTSPYPPKKKNHACFEQRAV